jgi:hypothetical protein
MAGADGDAPIGPGLHVNVIILTHDVLVPGSLANFGNPVAMVVATTAAQLPGRLAPGRWTIVRRDRWQYDERTAGALRVLAAFPGVEMIDPTGLLGGSRYGRDVGREEKAPIVQRSLRGRVASQPPPPRKRQPRASS